MQTRRDHTWSERVLLRLSRDADLSDYSASHSSHDVDHALDGLLANWPDLPRMVSGRRVLDFGCGHGFQSVALAKAGAGAVVGVDINTDFLSVGRDLARRHGASDRVTFVDTEKALDGNFDIVISLDSMEHFSDPAAALNAMWRATRPGGVVLVSFAPPWYAPYGAHMHFFTRVPWVHLVFSERTIMNVRSHYRNDGATRYDEVEGGLNQMSLRKFERLVAAMPFSPVTTRYETVKNLPIVARIPGVRELLVNRVVCTLTRP